MQIEKIDDKPFRIAAVQSFNWRDSPRRFQLHFTDMVSCLLCSLSRKIFPEADKGFEEGYTSVLDWVGGLGFDNIITEKISGKRVVWIDGMQGNVDMIFGGIPYELTSSLYLSKKVKDSNDLAGYYRYKIDQLRFYMAAMPSKIGKLKIIERAGERRKDPSGKPTGRPRPKEHTWKIKMTALELARLRIEMIRRKDILCQALATGNILYLFEHRDSLTPLLKSSFCIDPTTGYCSEWPRFQGDSFQIFQDAWKEWLTIALDSDEETRLSSELRKWR